MAVFERFVPGQPVLYRGPHVDDSGITGPPVICDLKPVTVVEDSAAVISLFLQAGTPTLMSKPNVAGAPKPWNPGEWELIEAAWDRWNTLYLQVPGEWRSTWVMWSPDWRFLGWYVNLQEPLRRTRWGFDVRDLQLDILVAADRTWKWKDEDDFERSIECGLISAEHAAQVRESAAASIRDIECGAWPFETEIADWRPDSGWARRSLPDLAIRTEVLAWSAGDAIERC